MASSRRKLGSFLTVLCCFFLFGYASYTLSSPAGSSPAKDRPEAAVQVKLAAVGDVVFGRQKDRKLNSFGYNEPFALVKSLFAGHDIVMGNLETPITSRQIRWMRGIMVFRALPEAAGLLRQAGFTLMVTSNNHARDQDDAGLVETTAHLKAAGLEWVGTGATMRRAWQPYIFRKNGLSVGFIAVNTIRNYRKIMKGAYYAYLSARNVRKYLAYTVRAIRKHVDFMVVSLHYGDEYKHLPTKRERGWIKAIARAGCDLFLGHHPHVLRGVQVEGSMVAFYSLGNFMFDQGWIFTRETGMARIVLEKRNNKTRIRKAELVPLLIGRDRRPRPVHGKTAGRILNKVLDYSRPLGSIQRLKVKGDRLFVDLP